MNRRGYLVATAALTVTVAGLLQETALAGDRWQEPWPDELELSQVQRAGLDSLRELTADAMFQTRIQIKMAKIRLKQPDASTRAQIADKGSRMETLRLLKADLKLSSLRFQESVRRVLSAEQWQRWLYYRQDLRVDRAGHQGELVSFDGGKGRHASTRHLRNR